MNNELIVAWKKSIHLISVDYLFVGKILLYIIHPLLNKIYPTCDPDVVCGDLLAATVHPAVQYSTVWYSTEYGTQYTVPAVPGARVPRLEAGHRERVRGSVQADPGQHTN